MMDVLGRVLGAQPNQQAYANASPNASFQRPTGRRRRTSPVMAPGPDQPGLGFHHAHGNFGAMIPGAQPGVIPRYPTVGQLPTQAPTDTGGPVQRDPTVGQLPTQAGPIQRDPTVGQMPIPTPPAQSDIPQQPGLFPGGVQNYIPRRSAALAHLFSS